MAHSDEAWQRWYDALTQRQKAHYHYNRRLFFDTGIVELADRALGYPEWTERIIQPLRKFGCLLFGHEMAGGYKVERPFCIYCDKTED